jgi:hypothetical protein
MVPTRYHKRGALPWSCCTWLDPLLSRHRRSREAAEQRRDAQNKAWNSAIEGLREVLAEHKKEHPGQPLAISDLFDGAKRVSDASATTIQLAFDRLESLDEAQYRVGKGVYVSSNS